MLQIIVPDVSTNTIFRCPYLSANLPETRFDTIVAIAVAAHKTYCAAVMPNGYVVVKLSGWALGVTISG